MTVPVVSRQFGGGSMFFLSLLVECLIISALTPLVSAASPLFELLDGVVELKLIVVVLVFVFMCLRR